MAKQYFSKDSLKFLAEPRGHNSRAWFEEHKNDYEKTIRGPALAVIGDMAGYPPVLSPYFTPIPVASLRLLAKLQIKC